MDPGFLRSGGEVLGRDGCRVPLPWTGGERPFGFSPVSGPSLLRALTWLPQPADWVDLTVEVQEANPKSVLQLYKSALHLRRSHKVLGGGKLSWVLTPEQSAATQVLHIRLSPHNAPHRLRPSARAVSDLEPSSSAATSDLEVEVLVNFGDVPVLLPKMDVLLSSAPLEGGFLPANASVILVAAPPSI